MGEENEVRRGEERRGEESRAEVRGFEKLFRRADLPGFPPRLRRKHK
jgi:hypothetical protein